MKYGVLFLFTGYIGYVIYAHVAQDKPIDFPDWVVVIFSLVFQYHQPSFHSCNIDLRISNPDVGRRCRDFVRCDFPGF